MNKKLWQEKLQGAKLRPTRQRLALAELLFRQGDRHVTAEMLRAEAIDHGIKVSLATLYNTLHQFVNAGLLREVAIKGDKAFFDTNTSDHFHFLFEEEGRLVDIPSYGVRITNLPEVPGNVVTRIDVLIRLAPRR